MAEIEVQLQVKASAFYDTKTKKITRAEYASDKPEVIDAYYVDDEPEDEEEYADLLQEAEDHVIETLMTEDIE